MESNSKVFTSCLHILNTHSWHENSHLPGHICSPSHEIQSFSSGFQRVFGKPIYKCSDRHWALPAEVKQTRNQQTMGNWPNLTYQFLTQACELMMVFTFLKLKKNILQYVKIYEIQISVFIVLLECYHPLSFM